MSKELTVYDPSKFSLTVGGMNLPEIIKENFGPEGIKPSDLDRIKIPSGGGTSWTVTTPEGEADQKEINCIIIFSCLARSYYATEYTGGNNPPDCYSTDMMHGIGTPGGDCTTCEFSQWESDSKPGSKGKACKERRLLFVLLPGDSLPTLIRIPPTSLKKAKQYLIQLTKRRMAYPTVITRLTLSKEKGDGVPDYSGVNFSCLGPAPEPEKYLELARALRPTLEKSAKQVVEEEAPEEEAPF